DTQRNWRGIVLNCVKGARPFVFATAFKVVVHRAVSCAEFVQVLCHKIGAMERRVTTMSQGREAEVYGIREGTSRVHHASARKCLIHRTPREAYEIRCPAAPRHR